VSKIDIDVSFDHPVERVWQALTDARLLSQWLLPTDLEPEIGCVFSLIGGSAVGLPDAIRGEVSMVVPRRMLAMTWRAHFLASQITWELLPTTEGGCTLFVSQTGFASMASIMRRADDVAAYRRQFTDALPQLLDGMALRAELAAEIAPPPQAVTLSFGKGTAAHTRSSSYRGRRGIGAAAAIARWPRHRVTAAIAGAVALIVLVVLIASGISLFTGSTPSDANPALGAPASSVVPEVSSSPVVVIGSASPSPSAISSRATSTLAGHPTTVPSVSVSPTVASHPTAAAAAPLSGRYATSDTWDGGYSGEITLTAAARSYSTWVVTITIPASASISTAWEATYEQHGGTATFKPESWTDPVSPGAPVTFGFQISYSGSPTHPLSCSVASTPCAGV